MSIQKVSGTINRILRFGFSGLSVLSTTGLITLASVQRGDARYVKGISVPCWYFQGETLKLKQTCKFSHGSWLGGSASRLEWADGVTTVMSRGLIGHGDKPCNGGDVVDNYCAKTYTRDLRTMKRVADSSKLDWARHGVECIQALGSQKSVCWKEP